MNYDDWAKFAILTVTQTGCRVNEGWRSFSANALRMKQDLDGSAVDSKWVLDYYGQETKTSKKGENYFWELDNTLNEVWDLKSRFQCPLFTNGQWKNRVDKEYAKLCKELGIASKYSPKTIRCFRGTEYIQEATERTMLGLPPLKNPLCHASSEMTKQFYGEIQSAAHNRAAGRIVDDPVKYPDC